MEIVRFEGIELIVTRERLLRNACWTSLMPPGFWCGILQEGTVRTSREGVENLWGPKTLINCWVDGDIEVEHVVSVDCTLGAAFIRVLPDHAEKLLGHESAHAMLWPNKTTVVQNNLVASGLTWQMLNCPLSGAARRLYLAAKAFEVLSTLAVSSVEGVDYMTCCAHSLYKVHC